MAAPIHTSPTKFIVGKYESRDEAWTHVTSKPAGKYSMQQSFDGSWVVIDVKLRNKRIKEENAK